MSGDGISVNGEPRAEVPESVRALVEAEGLDPERPGIAVARNGRVVPRGDWASTALAPGDAVEIVKPFSGG